MRRVILICLISSLIVQIISSSSYASTGGNTGLTGLWEYPTAEMPDDGVGRFGYTNASPYGYYFLDLAWLPWLEINARFSTFSSVSMGRRRYMDKAIDLKAMLWHNDNPQYWFIPSVALGVSDIMGTELMKTEYWVATWRWGSVAATVGYGTDRFNGVFGGLEWDIGDWLTIKAEYTPLDYTYDVTGAGAVLPADKLPSDKDKYNVGITVKAPWGMEGSASFQRGDELVFGISQRIDLNGPFIGDERKNFNSPGYPRVPDWDRADKEELISRIKSGLETYTRVRDVDIKLEDEKLTLSYENYGYSSHAEAMVRVLVVLAAVMPETSELVLIHKNAGVPIVKAKFPGCLLFDIRARNLRDEDCIHGAVFSWASSDVEDPDAVVLTSKAQHELKAMVVYEPRIDQNWEKAYMDRADIDVIYNGRYSHGWDGVFDVRFPFYNNVNIEDTTGIWWEKDLNDEVRIQQAALTYANSIGNSGQAWLFGEGGYIDEEWFGSNIWARFYSPDGRFWIGGRFAYLHDRDPFSFGGLSDGRIRFYYNRIIDRTDDGESEWRSAHWIQAGFSFTDLDVDFEADYGRFADNDHGWKLSITRHWDSTALGFYYVDTEWDAPGKGFTRAGVHMEIPAEKWFGTWFGNSSSHIWEQDTLLLSAWDLEAGREGGHIRTPERLMSQLRPIPMKKNVEKFLRDYCSYDDEEYNARETQEIKSLLDYILQ